MSKYWFKNWFDTEYYHLLYHERDEHEAEQFMLHLTTFLKLKVGSTILDLPCGRGRHAIYLNALGYSVTGADISENSLLYANPFATENLNFIKHDMRDKLPMQYNAIFNLFTSFGYFENDSDNIEILKNFKEELTENGVLVIDFLNNKDVEKNLVRCQTISKNGIDFYINRSVNAKFIEKHIRFEANGKKHEFVERVRNLGLTDFKRYFKKAGLQLSHTFGDYNLNPYENEHANRLIMIVR